VAVMNRVAWVAGCFGAVGCVWLGITGASPLGWDLAGQVVHEFSAPAPSAGPIGAPSAPSLSGDGQPTAAPQGSDGAPWPVPRFIDGCEANPAPYSCDPVGRTPQVPHRDSGWDVVISIGAAVAALALIGGCAGVGWWLLVRRCAARVAGNGGSSRRSRWHRCGSRRRCRRTHRSPVRLLRCTAPE
jgi:hypothetical protein